MKSIIKAHIFAAIVTASLCCFTSSVPQSIFAQDYLYDDDSTVCNDYEIIVEEPLADELPESLEPIEDTADFDELIDSELASDPDIDLSEEFTDLLDSTSESMLTSADSTNEETFMETFIESDFSETEEAAFAEDITDSGSCGENVIWEISGTDNNLTLSIRGSGEMDSFPWNSPPWYAFVDKIKTINVGESITHIGDHAFSLCYNVSEISLPLSLNSIGSYAFYCCHSLTSISIPEGVSSIGDHAFSGCNSLTSILFPQGVSSIGAAAFDYCYSLTSISIPEGVSSIEDATFNDCSGLTSISIPKSVSSIGRLAFSGCSKLTSISIPDGVSSIGENAFSSCNSLISVSIPEGVSSIEDSMFWYCSNLTSVSLPAGLSSIGYRAFGYCSSLTSISIPKGVSSIGEEAFQACSSLTSISIPKGVSSIEDRAFWDCSSLTSISIPESVSSIGAGAFSDCDSLTSIPIPDGVSSIGENAFSWCSSLTSISIPESVSSIGEDALAACPCLTTISIPVCDFRYIGLDSDQSQSLSTLTLLHGNISNSIVSHAFEDFTSLTSVSIADGITSIGDYAFFNCNKLTSISIPDSVYSIGANAFYSCSSLKTVPLPNSLQGIDAYTFYKCSNLKEIYIPTNLKYIDSYAFYGCVSLSNIELPHSLTAIGQEAFMHCENLSNITIPDGVKYIANHTFEECKQLSRIDLPDNLIEIGLNAFNGCVMLKDIYYPNTLDAWKSIKRSDLYQNNANLDVTIITLHTADGDYSIRVGDDTRSISLNKKSAKLMTNKIITLKATITPPDTYSNKIIWSSDNQAVAKVDDGRVTACKRGTATITAALADNQDIKATCKITVVSPYVISFIKGYEKATLSVSRKNIMPGSTYGTLPVPKLNGYLFIGWYNAEKGGKKISSKDKPSGSIKLYAHWKKRQSVKDAVVKVAACNYTSKLQKPKVTVMYGKKILVEGSDYTLTYAKNRKATSKYPNVTITGINAYSGTKTVNFKINPANVGWKIFRYELSKTQYYYDGKAKKPDCSIKMVIGKTQVALIKNTDYTIQWSNNVKTGTAKLTIKGKGNYCGSKTLTFKILPSKKSS